MGSSKNYETVTRRQPDVEDYIDMLRRYRSWVIGPTFAGVVIAVVVAFCWPDTFVSRAVLRITPPAVPANLVEGAGATPMQQRLEQMEVQILGRTSLMGIIQEPALDLYKKDRAHITLDEVAERMRTKDIHVHMYDAPGTNSQRGAQAFVLSFGYSDRFKAQAVVREIAGKFVDSNFLFQRNQAGTISTFLTDELKTAKERVDAAQEQLTLFAAQHPGELPQDAMTNMAAVNGKEQEIHSLEENLGRLQGDKALQESQIANVKLLEATTAANIEQTQITPGSVGLSNDRIVNFDRQINDAKAQLRSAQSKYKDDYPEVAALKKHVKELEDEQADLQKEALANQAPATGPTLRTVQSPAMVNRLAELQMSERGANVHLNNLQAEIDRDNKRMIQLNSELGALQAKVAASPALAQHYAELEGEFKRANDDYDAKSKKRDQSQSSENLEEHHAGETLEILETADLPDSPEAPNRWAIIGIGTFLGLLAGFGMAGAKELKDTSLKNLKDVRAYTNLPVLSSVPLLENALLVRRKRRLAWLAWSSALVIGSILMSGAAYYYVSGKAGPS